MSRYTTAWAGVLAAGLMSGCAQDMSDLETYIADIKSRKSRAIEPIPQMKPYEAFVYIPAERRDPFEPPRPAREIAAAGAGGGIQPDLNRNKEPLEEFPLDALKMIGTILIKDRSYALVQAPDGLVHRATRGDHMGQNFGEILQVSETEVQLIEIIPDGFGGWMQRPASIALAE